MTRVLIPLLLLTWALPASAASFYGFAGGSFLQGLAATVQVPDVIGDDEATATTTIEGTGSLTVGSVLTACSATTINLVIRTVPSVGTTVADTASIDLVLSTGVKCSGSNGVRLKGLRIGL